jgi:hypothetical protein
VTAQVAAERTGVLIDDLLDRLAVTDRVYHDLKHTQPLVEVLVARAVLLAPDSRVLVIAPNVTLPAALVEMGYDVTLWHVPDGILTAELQQHAERIAPLDELLSQPVETPPFDLIVLPFVLEATFDHPLTVLTRLRRLISSDGRILIAYRRPGGISLRMRALAGRSTIPDPIYDAAAPSFSWPPLPQRRIFGASELRSWSQTAGLRLDSDHPVVERGAALPIHALGVGDWLAAQAGHAVRHAFPPLRDCGVAELAPLPHAAWRVRRRDEVRGDLPYVSVLVTRQEQGRLDILLDQLAAQSYPADSFEVLVPVGDDSSQPAPVTETPFRVRYIESNQHVGPAAANALLRAAEGDIVALTDDLALPPRGWLDIGVEGVSGLDVALTGRLSAHGLSALPFIALPGLRPIPKDEDWFPASNTFYVREAALEAGGFEESHRLGWENTLPDRLQALGYSVRFEPLVHLVRRFPFPPPGGRRSWMSHEFRQAYELPAVISRKPRLRRSLLWRRVFAARRTMYFDVALVGLVLTAVFRQPLWLVLVLPWLLSIRRYVPYWPLSNLGTGIRNLRGIVFRHLIWLSGLVAGSVRARRVVL